MASPSFTIGSMSAVTSISAVTMIAPVQRFKMLNFSSMVYLLSMVGSVGEHRSIHAGCVIGPERSTLSGLVALLCGHGDADGGGDDCKRVHCARPFLSVVASAEAAGSHQREPSARRRRHALSGDWRMRGSRGRAQGIMPP